MTGSVFGIVEVSPLNGSSVWRWFRAVDHLSQETRSSIRSAARRLPHGPITGAQGPLT